MSTNEEGGPYLGAEGEGTLEIMKVEEWREGGGGGMHVVKEGEGMLCFSEMLWGRVSFP